MPGIYTAAAPLRAGAAGPGESVPITVADPDGTVRGGIVVLYSSAKHTEPQLDLLLALAEDGWIALAPNLFHRSDDQKDSLFVDFDGCFDWLIQRGVFADCIGVLGFDAAGTAAFLVATDRPIGAAVSVATPGIVTPLYAGSTPPLVAAAANLRAPWLGLYGEDDPNTPPGHIAQLEDAVARAEVATNIVTYPGLRHRADQDPGEPDDEIVSARTDAQTRIFDWFDSNLR